MRSKRARSEMQTIIRLKREVVRKSQVELKTWSKKNKQRSKKTTTEKHVLQNNWRMYPLQNKTMQASSNIAH